MNLQDTNRFFVSYNAKNKEIAFNYVGDDDLVGFPPVASNGSGCNRAAVYNIVDNNWTFDDLPYVFGAAEANLDQVVAWSTTTSSWESVGGTWLDQEDSLKRVPVMIGDANTDASLSRSLYAFDQQGLGSVIALPVDENATKGWQLSRDGIDLDEVGADLTGYKVISSIFPQARLETDAEPIDFSFGSADYFNNPVEMTDVQTYDGNTLYKLDYNASGRYLMLHMAHDDWHYINISGFDLDLDVTGER